jgi:hypothetical protein
MLKLASLAPLAAIATTAHATIIMVDASSIQGANVLFNSGTQTGPTVFGKTQGGTNVVFTGTSTASNVLQGDGGQSRVQGDLDTTTSNPNDTYLLTSLSFALANGGTFNNLEFNLFGGTATSVDFHLTDNTGSVFNFLGQALGNGSNFFGFQGIDGESIKSITYNLNGGGIQDQRQLRLDESSPTLNSAVPEPATWVMLILGFGMSGFFMRTGRKAPVRVHLAR